VVECSNEKKTLDAIRKKVENSFDEKQRARIFTFEPEEFFGWLDQEAAKEASTETRTKGYRVKVQYTAVSGEEAKHMGNSILKTVAEATRKKQGK
jgi:hypothetical protein